MRSSVSTTRAAFANDDGRGLGPAAGDIGQNQTVNVAAAVDASTVRHQVHFHAARRRIIPIGKGAHLDAPPRLRLNPFAPFRSPRLRGARSKRSTVAALIDRIFGRICSSSFRCPLRSRAGNRIGSNAFRALAAHPIGCLPQHNQRSANGFIIERCRVAGSGGAWSVGALFSTRIADFS